MAAHPNVAVNAAVHFPILDEDLTFDISDVLKKLSADQLCDLQQELDDEGRIQDPNLVNVLLQASKDPAVMRTYADYAHHYCAVSGRLREHRGYGLEGDEEPEMVLPLAELMAWFQAKKPSQWLAYLEIWSDLSMKQPAGI